MTAILRRLPFQEKEDEVTVGHERLPVRPYQIIAWAGVTARGVVDHSPSYAPGRSGEGNHAQVSAEPWAGRIRSHGQPTARLAAGGGPACEIRKCPRG
jgi:hypothetical protein